jgi:hypothetical protein
MLDTFKTDKREERQKQRGREIEAGFDVAV